MRKQLLCSAFLTGLAACSSSNASHPDGGTPLPDATTPPTCEAGGSSAGYVLIDDMETTTHGPIQFSPGISAPLTQGYWYNSGAGYHGDAGVPADTSTPPQMSFVFTALSSPTKTLNCTKTSANAARQNCALNGLYDTCGVGFEFAQLPDVDAGADPADAGPGSPKYTVPFDISHYKAVTFWGMTTTPDPSTGSLHVKISFPDTDTDPRGQVCNGGGLNTSKCYNSYATYFEFTTTWQQFTVTLDAGDGGVPAVGGIYIDPSWGYQGAQWLPTQVYGINWQAQRNTDPGNGPPLMTDIWVDDVYFVE
jgi:hypothetical protein